MGAVVLRGLRLLIQPKVPLHNLFFMLGYGAGLTTWRDDQFPYADDPDLLRAVGWVFDAEVRKALIGGVVRGYEPRQDTLPTLRGRIDIAAQIRMRQDQPFPLECRYDDYTADIELNRILKAAIVRLLHIPALDPRLARALRFRLHSFEEVSTAEYAAPSVPDLTFNRLNDRWESAARLAQLILRNRSLQDAEGSVTGTGFTVDMSQLFERFVETVVAQVATERGWRVEPQRERKLAPGVAMQPDLIVSRGERDHAVADVKYKLPERGWTHEDLYQMLAYCVALGLSAGLLIYAGGAPFDVHVVNHLGVRLEVVGLDASASRAELLTQTREIGRYLVCEAERHLASSGTPRILSIPK